MASLAKRDTNFYKPNQWFVFISKVFFARNQELIEAFEIRTYLKKGIKKVKPGKTVDEGRYTLPSKTLVFMDENKIFFLS